MLKPRIPYLTTRYPETGESGEAYDVEMTRAGNGPYVTALYSDGLLHVNITITKEMHDRIIAAMMSTSDNRTKWIRQAITERLEREEKKNGQ